MRSQVVEDYYTRCGKAGLPIIESLVIDAHGHLDSTSGFPYMDSGPQELVEAMDRLGINRIYVSSTWAIYGLARRGNDHVIDAVRRYPGRLRGYMVADVGYPERIPPELERCYAAGLRAIKIWSYGNRPGLPYDHPNYRAIFDFAQERGLPILAHTWGDELDQLDEAFGHYDGICWLLAHTGCKDLDKYIRCANNYPRVHLETCLSRCPRGLIEHLVTEVPLRQIVWGSDQVFMSSTNQLGRVLFAQIAPEEKRAVLGENAARVLDPRPTAGQ